MSPSSLIATPPKGLLRFILRLPIVLYRLRLGWLLGGRFVLLNHFGRKTGQLRRAVVEVVGHDKESDTYYIVSGWGYEANWYQNVLARPQITIQVGRRRLDVCAETMPTKAGTRVLLDYRQKHPFAARQLSHFMGLNLSEASPEEFEGIIQESLPVVALQPRKS